MRLLLIRHAESIGNQAGRLPVRVGDPLTPTGIAQAQRLATFLNDHCWQPTHLYSSPLERALQTAEILHQSLPVTVASPVARMIRQELQEIDQGILAGLTWAEAQVCYPKLCQQLESCPELLPIPEAETSAQVQQRTQTFFQSLLSQHRDQDRLWLVTHGGVLPYLLAAILASPRVWGLTVPNTGVFEFELDRERWNIPEQQCNSSLWRLGYFNATPHLPAG